MKATVLLTIFSFILSGAGAQNRDPVLPKPSAGATVTSQKVLLGEPFLLKLTATVPKGSTVNWFQADTIPHFEIVQRSKIDSQVNGKSLELQQILTLASFDSGRWNIPAFTLGRIKTKPIPIDVVFTSPFDPRQPYHEIKDIVDVQRPEDSKWIWILVGLLLLTVLFALFFPKRKKPVAAFPRLVPKDDPYDEAYNRLKKLMAAGIESTEPKRYYSELVDILREYLHRRKNIQSFSKTTGDLSIQIGKLDLEKDQYNKLVQVLRISDGVKFARFEPSVEESKQSLHVIHQSILAIEDMNHAV